MLQSTLHITGHFTAARVCRALTLHVSLGSSCTANLAAHSQQRTPCLRHTSAPVTQRLLLIDTCCEASRVHFGYGERRLHNDRGEDTTIVHGLLKDVLTLLNICNATHLAFVQDGPDNCAYRRELYPQYKAGREPTPAVLSESLKRLEAVLSALEVPLFRVPGVEADDVIAYITQQALDEGMAVDLVSVDKDFFQLLAPNVRMWRRASVSKGAQGKGSFFPFTHQDFTARYNVLPEQWADCLALMGDKSDNVPGVKGIGEKTVSKLMQQFHSLDGVLSAQQETILPRSAAAALSHEHNRELAMLSKSLVIFQPQLAQDAMTILDWSTMEIKQPKDGGAKARQLLSHWQLTTVLAECQSRFHLQCR